MFQATFWRSNHVSKKTMKVAKRKALIASDETYENISLVYRKYRPRGQ